MRPIRKQQPGSVGFFKVTALVVAAAGLAAASPAFAQSKVRCYGVALAGENEGLDDRRDEGSSTVDYQGNAWVMEDPAKCVRIALPVQPDGTPRRGALEPLERDQGS